jgi:hypothetical protein
MSKEYIDVLPTNVNQAQAVSYRDGNPLVEFKIGAQQRYLLGSTIRLNGEICVFGADNVQVGVRDINMDPRLGVYACLDQLVISSAKTSQTIEHIKNYNTMLSTYLPVTSSPQDLETHMGVTSLSSAAVSANTNLLMVEALVTDAGDGHGGSEFSIPLPCGFFLGQNPIPLSQTWGVQGINIQLFLAPDSAVLFSKDSTSGAAAGSYYQIRNLHLTAEVSSPPPDQLSQLMRQKNNSYEYNSISGFYATIQNSYATVNFQLGLKRVLSFWSSFITSSHINSYNFNSFARPDLRDSNDGLTLAKIKEVFFTRDAIRFPQEYIISTVKHADDSIEKGEDPQIMRNFINAVSPFGKLRRTTVSPYNTPGRGSIADKDLPDGGNLFGIGCALDIISNQGVDYSNSQFGMVINSSLKSNAPQSVFVFVHAKQTLLMNAMGIQVLK